MDHDITVIIHEADRFEPDLTIILTPIDSGEYLRFKDQGRLFKTHTVLAVVRLVLGIMPFELNFHFDNPFLFQSSLKNPHSLKA